MRGSTATPPPIPQPRVFPKASPMTVPRPKASNDPLAPPATAPIAAPPQALRAEVMAEAVESMTSFAQPFPEIL